MAISDSSIGGSSLAGGENPGPLVSTFVFDVGAFSLQGQGTPIVWGSDTIKIRLVDVSVTPVNTATSISGYTAIGTDATLASKTVINDTVNHRTVYSAANPTITSPGTATYASAVVYKDGADDAHRVPIFCLGLSGSTAGADVLLTINVAGLGNTPT